jgi:hypothetical protein
MLDEHQLKRHRQSDPRLPRQATMETTPPSDLLTQLTINLLNYWMGRCNDLKSAAAIKAAADLIRKMEGRTAAVQ